MLNRHTMLASNVCVYVYVFSLVYECATWWVGGSVMGRHCSLLPPLSFYSVTNNIHYIPHMRRQDRQTDRQTERTPLFCTLIIPGSLTTHKQRTLSPLTNGLHVLSTTKLELGRIDRIKEPDPQQQLGHGQLAHR